jgi:hypothetical protein
MTTVRLARVAHLRMEIMGFTYGRYMRRNTEAHGFASPLG